jgi:CHAT domain-containing protein
MAEGEELGSYRVVHFATHALTDDERPEQSALVLSRRDLPDDLDAALAGRRIFDGLLDAKEVVRGWKIDVDLVVLSGCSTGLGKEVAGEGYLGLATAFLQVGARSVLVSLWPVEDHSTSLLMRRFYENWTGASVDGGAARGPMSKVEALREAKSWLRSKYSPPFYWAGFILIGDPS